MLSTKQVAEITGYNIDTIKIYCREGKIKARKNKKTNRWEIASQAVTHFLKARGHIT